MVNFFKNGILIFSVFILNRSAFSQSCITPSVNAQAGTGPSTVVCLGQCANLTATVVPPPNSTTTYSVASIAYTTFPYVGGSNAFATTLDDTWSDTIDIGFNFCYYGNTFKKLVVGANGEITFDLTNANNPETWVCSTILPNLIEHPGNTICGAYRDYDPYPGGVIRTYTTGVAPCRAFVVYWSAVTLYSCAFPLSSFQIVLYEGSNRIGVNIQNSTPCLAWNGGRGLIGIQNAAGTTVVAPPTRNVLFPWLAINESWLFVPTAAPNYSVSWAGPSGFSASGLTATPCPTATGNYTATMSYCSGSVSSVVQVSVGTSPVVASASSNTICSSASTTLTGTGATSYTWQTPTGVILGSTAVVSPTANTTYTLIGSNGTCTNSTTKFISVASPPLVSAFNLSGTICAGSSANCIATGALTYTWNPGGIIGNIVALSPTVSTTYTITGSNGVCTNQATLSVPVISVPALSAVNAPTSICAGSSATLTASGALSYTWNPGAIVSNSIIVSPLVTTIYSVTGNNAFGCLSAITATQQVNPTPLLTITPSTSSICIGATSTLTASGATGFTWSPGGLTTPTITVTPTITTTYTLLGIIGSCTNSTTSTLTVIPIPTVSATSSATQICSGNSTTLTGAGATNYTWNPGAITGTTVVFSPTLTTTYTLIGSASSCTNIALILINVNNGPTLNTSASSTNICVGASSTLSVNGALSYTWYPGALVGGTVVVTPTATTNYSVIGNNSFGCTTTKTLAINVTPNPTVTANSTSSAVCSGNNATLTANGATSYTWNPGAFSSSSLVITPLINTTYTLSGLLAGCQGQTTIAISVLPLPTVTAVSSSTAICNGNSTTLTATGATTYTWFPLGLSGSVVSVSPSSTATYTVIGNNGTCASTNTVTVIVNLTPTLTANTTPTTICVSGNVTLTATGANTYTWLPPVLVGSTVVDFIATTTNYTVIGLSVAGCSSTAIKTVIVNSLPSLTVIASPTAICAGTSATLTALGALGYTWNPGSLTSNAITVTPATSSNYTVVGSNGACFNTQTVGVIVNPIPTITVAASSTNICVGSSATLSASGATSYTWNPGAITGTTLIDTPASTTLYSVTGAFVNGCTSTQTVNIVVTPNPTLIPVANSTAICLGNSSTLTATGASNYTWNPSALTGSNVVVSPTVSTTYTVNGVNGICASSQTVSVVVNTISAITVGALPNPICAGQTVSLTAFGAITYTWNPIALTGSLVTNSPIVTTTYSVTGTNLFGCTNNTVLTVTVNPLPTLSILSTATTICSGSSATLTGIGAGTFTWSPGAITGNTISLNPTSTINYTVLGLSPSGCSNTATFNLSVTPIPTVLTSASNLSICVGNSSTLAATGATNYTWNPGALTGSIVVVSPTVSTTYTVVGSNGICASSQTVSIIVNPSPIVTISSTNSVICSGTQLTLTANGANTYSWLPPIAAISQTVTDTPLSSTIYTVNATAINGCTNLAVYSVMVNTTPTITAISSPTSLCSGNSATLSANGATSYTWLPSGLTASLTVVNPTITTTYSVTGDNGLCTTTETLSLIVNPNPVVTINTSSALVCSGITVSLTASGASTYSWNPIGLTGATVTNTPTSNTTFTVIGTDLNGCSNQAQVTVSVNPLPTLAVAASPTAICLGGTATLSAAGALSYTWSPGSVLGGTIAVTPSITTNYSVVGLDALGCSNTQTISLLVLPNPTVTAVSSSTGICSGSSATLTASGALTYTWEPGTISGSVAVISPTVTTIYTLTTTNGICGVGINTISVSVNTLPIAAANVSGTITCVTLSVNLIGSATPTNVTYLWNGPSSFSSVAQSPTGLASPGNYTLVVTDATTGCSSASATTAIVSNSNAPSVSVTVSGSITCSNNSATITALPSATNISYSWIGPVAFTNTNSAITVSVGGNYSLTVTDLISSCIANTIVTVFTNTNVPISATLVPATCSGTITNNDASIIVAGFSSGDKFDYVIGSTYTGTAIYTSAATIPLTGILTNTISNPIVLTAYTVRFFGANGCIKDTTVFLTPTSCITNTVFGISKAVSSSSIQANGTYNVTYKVVIKNYGSVPINNVILIENLAATFPLPAAFSIVSNPAIITPGSSLVLNPTFDGALQNSLTTTLSVLNPNSTDTILFTLNINPKGVFGTYKNSIVGFSQPSLGIALVDSSNVGINPDPDGDGYPTNNNIPTPLNFSPKLLFALTKVGAISDKLQDNTYDISYTLTAYNLGNDTLQNIVIKDSLFNATIKQPATYSLKSGPVPLGSLIANTNFNGNTDINLTLPSQSKLAPGFASSISFTINVDPDTITVIKNTAFGRALSSTSIAVSDTSGSGINPDINGNGVSNESTDNNPTLLTVSNSTLFVPEGFSPNDDNVNDLWVIKGFPKGIENTVTVFNRWGNKVYEKTNYDNTWNGFPNVTGTLGNEKLPQGTYYYIIEFKSGNYKALNGYVILQY